MGWLPFAVSVQDDLHVAHRVLRSLATHSDAVVRGYSRLQSKASIRHAAGGSAARSGRHRLHDALLAGGVDGGVLVLAKPVHDVALRRARGVGGERGDAG